MSRTFTSPHPRHALGLDDAGPWNPGKPGHLSDFLDEAAYVELVDTLNLEMGSWFTFTAPGRPICTEEKQNMPRRVARKCLPGVERLEPRETPSAGLAGMHQALLPVVLNIEGSGTFTASAQSGTIEKVLFPRLTLQGKVSPLGDFTGMIEERFEATAPGSGRVEGRGSFRWFGGLLRVAVNGSWTTLPGGVPAVAANLEYFRAGSPGPRRPGAFSGLGSLTEVVSLTPQGQFAPSGAFAIKGEVRLVFPGGLHGPRHV